MKIARTSLLSVMTLFAVGLRLVTLSVKALVSLACVVVYNAIPRDIRVPFAYCATNTIDPDLKLEVILDTFLETFVDELLPLNAFATDFSADVIDEGDKVKVGYVPAAAAARSFNGTYTVQESDWQKKEVEITEHEYVSWGLSDVDLFKGSLVNLQMHTRMKAHALAAKVIANILSVVTAENYGAHVFAGAANTFDLDDVADIRTACVKSKWPKMMRNLVLGADYYGNVVKENVFQDAGAAGGTTTRETGQLPRLYSFTPYECETLPDNAENLVGFANMPSAIAVGMRYLKPRRPEKYIDARPVSHEKTGLTFGFRHDYDTKTGVEAYFFECNFGKAPLEAAALKRILSVAP